MNVSAFLESYINCVVSVSKYSLRNIYIVPLQVVRGVVLLKRENWIIAGLTILLLLAVIGVVYIENMINKLPEVEFSSEGSVIAQTYRSNIISLDRDAYLVIHLKFNATGGLISGIRIRLVYSSDGTNRESNDKNIVVDIVKLEGGKYKFLSNSKIEKGKYYVIIDAVNCEYYVKLKFTDIGELKG
jgi:hypothetical protein